MVSSELGQWVKKNMINCNVWGARRRFNLDLEKDFDRKRCKLWNFEISGPEFVQCGKAAYLSTENQSQLLIKVPHCGGDLQPYQPLVIIILGIIKYPLQVFTSLTQRSFFHWTWFVQINSLDRQQHGNFLKIRRRKTTQFQPFLPLFLHSKSNSKLAWSRKCLPTWLGSLLCSATSVFNLPCWTSVPHL